MNKKRHFLEAPEVKGYLVKGERFTKWSEVSEYFNISKLRFYFYCLICEQRKSFSSYLA